MPKHVAVLSFAGLDRDDVLLYPLLAHELGHFLDFASDDIGDLSTDSKTASRIPSMQEALDAGVPAEHYDGLVEKIRICLRELTADLLAARMAGIGYLFAFNEFFKTLTPWPGPLVNPDSGYPGFGLRLKLIYQELSSNKAGMEAIKKLENIISSASLPGKKILEQYLDRLRARVQSMRPSKPTKPVSQLMEKTVQAAIPDIQDLVQGIIPNERAAKVPDDLVDMITLLEKSVPPFQPPTRTRRQSRNFDPWSFHEILTAGWLYQIAIGEERERALPPEDRFKEYQNTCLLLLKALELEGAREAIRSITGQEQKSEISSKPKTSYTAAAGHGVVSGPSLRAALDREDAAERLVLCPEFGDEAIESASRDLHLGHWFRISRRTSLQSIDIALSAERAKARRQGQTEVFVPVGGTFILQPGDFGLGSSLEYLYLPPDMMAFVEGKSSLGRAGLIIATATQVAPGFKGCIVLELYNAGTVPIILRPAMRVAQLVLVSTDSKVPQEWLYSGSFQVQIKP